MSDALLNAAAALVRAVEGDGRIWREATTGFRLKDTTEWARFYVAAKDAHRDAEHAAGSSVGMVPRDPTTTMRVAGFESDAWGALADAVMEKGGWPYSCRQSAECVAAIWRAMWDAAPTPQTAPSPEPAAPASD